MALFEYLMLTKVFFENMSNICSYEGLEGLVIKDALSTYEPGKRHWLKVKESEYLSRGPSSS